MLNYTSTEVAKDMSTCTKVYPYYSPKEYRTMSNDDIKNKITFLHEEIKELEKELEKRTNKIIQNVK